MSELQSVRIENLTGGWNTLASKNSMAPNQGIVARNWIPFSNGSIGPRYGSIAFDNGALDMVAGQTLGMFQAYLSNGGRRLLFFTHTDKLNTLGGGANTNYTFIREYDPVTSGWRGSHQIVFSDSTLGGQYQSFAQMQDRVYRTDVSRGVRRTEFTHQGVADSGTVATAVQAPPAMSANSAVWNGAGYVNNVPAGYAIQRRLWHVKDAAANLRTDIAVTTNFAAATGTVTQGGAFPSAVAGTDKFDVISDLPAGLRSPLQANLTTLAPVLAHKPGAPAGRMVINSSATLAYQNYAYCLVPSSLQLGDHKAIKPGVTEFSNYLGAVNLMVGVAAAYAVGAQDYAVTFAGADLEAVAREAGLSPRPASGDTIKIYRSLINPGGFTAAATAGQAPQDADAWNAVPYYYVGSYTVGSLAAFVDQKNDNELVDQYSDPVLFSTPEEWQQHKFAYMCAHKGRMFYGYEVYNVTSGANFTRGSRLYWSDIGHPDRVVGYVDVGANDAGDITALFSFNGALFIGKQDKVYLLTGSSPSSFDLRLAIPHLGVLCPRTIASMGNELVWLSQSGFIAFDGSTVREISQPIKPDIDSMLRVLGTSYTNLTTAVAEIDRYWFFFPRETTHNVGGYGFLYDQRHTDGTWWYFNLDSSDTAGVPVPGTGNEGHVGIALNRTTHGGQLLIGSWNGGLIYDWQNINATLDGGSFHPALEWVSPNIDAGAPELVKQWRHIAIEVEKVDTGDTLTLSWYVDSDHPDVTSYTASGSFVIDTSTLPQTIKFSLPQTAFGRRIMFRLYNARSSGSPVIRTPVIAGVTIHYRLKRGARNREETR